MPSFRKTLDHGCQERDPPDGDPTGTILTRPFKGQLVQVQVLTDERSEQ